MSKNKYIDFTNTKISFNRPIGSFTKIQLLYSKFIRNKKAQIRKLKNSPKRLLNVGCGPNPATDFINLDYHWRPQVDLCWDITRGIPLPSESLTGIYSEHCLEHIEFSECQDTIIDFYRLLEPGGFIRIVVPDAELYLELYAKSRQGETVQFPYGSENIIKQEQTAIQSVNRVFRDFGHKFAYDFETLKMMLTKASFINIEKQEFMQGKVGKLLIDTESRKIESLYVEAQKPGVVKHL